MSEAPSAAGAVTTSVDVFNPEFKGLGALYKSVLAASPRPTAEVKMPFFDALQVPADPEGRTRFSTRVRELFASSLGRSFAPPELERVLAVADSIMPAPDSPDFEHAFRNRCCGVLTVLFYIASYRGTYSAEAATPDKRQQLVEYFESLIGDVPDSDTGIPVPFREVSPKVKHGVLHARTEALKTDMNSRKAELAESEVWKAKNGELFPNVSLKYKSLIAAFSDVIATHRKNVERFIGDLLTPELAKAQWMNALLFNLNKFDEKRPDAAQKLGELVQALADAKDVATFKQAISNFGKEALANADSPAPTAASPAVVPAA